MAVAPQNFAGTVSLNTSKYSTYLETIESEVSSGAINTSKVTCNLHVVRTNWGWITGTSYGGTITIDGTPTSISYAPNWGAGTSGDVIVGTASKVVTHNSDGTKTAVVAGVWNTSGTYSPGTVNVPNSNYVLTAIPRYATINSFTLTGKTMQGFTVNWSADATCDLVEYQLNGGAWVTGQSGDRTSGSFAITGLIPNTAYSTVIRVRRKDSQLYTNSSTVAITTYDYAKILVANDVTDEQNPSFTFSNPSGAVIDACIKILNPTSVITLKTLIPNSSPYTFVLTQGEKDLIYAKCGSASQTTIRYELITNVAGVDTYSSTSDKTFSIVNDNPTFTNFTFADTDAVTLALTGDSQKSIGKYSNITVTVPLVNKMVAIKGASPVKYVANINGGSVDITYSDTLPVSGTINNANGNIINVFAVDNRDNQTQAQKSITNIPYTETIINSMSFSRKDGVGTTVLITGSGTYDTVNFGAISNTVTAIDYRRKLKTTPTWTTETWNSILSYFTVSGGTAVNKPVNELLAVTWDLGVEYDVQVRYVDRLSTYTTNLIVNTGKVLMSALKDKGVCFGGLYNDATTEVMQVAGDQNTTGKLKVNGFITGQEASGSKAQINGFMRTGSIYLHDGGTGTPTVENRPLTNVAGVLKWDGNQVLDTRDILNVLTSTSTTDSLSAAQGKVLKDLVDGFKLTIYPVGAIYQSNVSTSPATLFGGTWVALTDRMLIGASGTYANGTTGGATTHTLTTNEMPSHQHDVIGGDGGAAGGRVYNKYTAGGINAGFAGTIGITLAIGGGLSHNNMSPYRSVYMWYRSA